MRVVFALLPERGHLNPYIGPAQALEELGHEVTVAAPGDVSEQVTRAGLKFAGDLIPEGPGSRVTKGAELVELIQDEARLAGWIEQLLLDGLEEQVARVRAWYEREHVRVAVIDPLYYAAAIAAHLCGIPWVAMSNSLNPVVPGGLDSALLRNVERIHERRASVFAAFGMRAEFSVCDVLSPFLNVVFATEELVGRASERVLLAGPSFPLRARGDEVELRPLPQGKPVVYASFGSQIYYWPELFARIREAARRVGAHLVLSMGDLTGGELKRTWADCDVYRYAPQLEVLKRAGVFVTHGGANSVMEAVAMGVPMLLSPMCNDQFHQGYFVRRAGLGCVEDLREAPTKEIAARLKFLMEDDGVRRRAKEVARAYRKDGARIAARAVEGLA